MSLKKNFLYNSVLKILDILYPLITVPYVSRVLGAEGVGQASFVTTYAGYFAVIAALGIPIYGTREIARHRDNLEKRDRILSELFSIGILCTLLLTIVYLITIYTVPTLHQERQLLLIAGFALYFSAFNLDWFFSGIENFKLITIRSAIVKILCVICLVIFVKDRNDVIIYVLLLTLVSVVNRIWNYLHLLKKKVRIRFTIGASSRRHLKPAFILFAATLAISVYTMLDNLMLGFMSDYQQVGYYSSASKVCHILIALLTGIGTVALPSIANHIKQCHTEEVKRILTQSTALIAFLTVPAAIGLIVLAPVAVPMFFGPDFAGAVTPMRWTALLLIVAGISNILGIQILLPHGYDRFYLYAITSGAVVNFGLNLAIIPVFGASGAAFASLGAEIVLAVIMLITIRKVVNIRFNGYPFLYAILACGIFVPVFYALKYTVTSPVPFCLSFMLAGGAGYCLIQHYLFKNMLTGYLLSKVKERLHA